MFVFPYVSFSNSSTILSKISCFPKTDEINRKKEKFVLFCKIITKSEYNIETNYLSPYFNGIIRRTLYGKSICMEKTV